MISEAELKDKVSYKNQVTSPIYDSRFQKLEKALGDLFFRELNSKNSIFIRVSPNIVKKLAMFLSGLNFRPAAIGICGETASGKSTIVMDSMEIIENFAKEFSPSKAIVTRINTDDYYYDRSKEVVAAGSFAEFAKTYDFDVPQAIELSLMKQHIQKLLQRKEVYLPKYDMSGTARRQDNCNKACPAQVIIAEGLYALNHEISDIFDFKIYVHINKDVQKQRFFDRAKKRNLGSSAENIFKNASQKAQIYVHPCAENADIILNGEALRERYKSFIAAVIEISISNYYNFAV